MEQSSLLLFCDECGLANDPMATHCSSCQHPLSSTNSIPKQPELTPILVSQPPIEETASRLSFTASGQKAANDIHPGSILADCYQIQEEIGRGGFSIVYRATEVGDRKRQVAIKRIPLNSLTPAQIIDATETFNRELTMLTRFSGRRGVPTFYGHLTDQENWYLVMEYIEGETLEACLQKAAVHSSSGTFLEAMPGGYFNENKAIHIGIELALILNELHTSQPPVIFRDVKPANIMLTPAKKLYLIDFGIARDFKWGKARDTTALGSPGYAAPEQYGRAQTNRRTDIYGLGATLQTLVTGRDPLELAAGEKPRNPQMLSPELRAVLNAMLSPEPVERPVDMLHVQMLLERIVSQKPQPEPASPDYRSTQFYAAVALLFVAATFIITSLTAFWLGFLFLAILGLSLGMCRKWALKAPALKRRTIVILLSTWVLFVLTWIIMALLRPL